MRILINLRSKACQITSQIASCPMDSQRAITTAKDMVTKTINHSPTGTSHRCRKKRNTKPVSKGSHINVIDPPMQKQQMIKSTIYFALFCIFHSTPPLLSYNTRNGALTSSYMQFQFHVAVGPSLPIAI